ncbi:helix-turn-helix domain-containing protein [Leucobacter chinensis]|uniref:helix-turn-helix domain-containing protein n=1 Tax=Leucobacter chinensis TaxID=2851010 RepID=UPI001C231D16|nr:helix-turn-helix domain-containing protein [Leucobacter chinensis]
MASVTDLLEAADLGLELVQAASLTSPISWVAHASPGEALRYADAEALIVVTEAAPETAWRDFVASLTRARTPALVWISPAATPHAKPPTALTQAAGDYQLTLLLAPAALAPAALARQVSLLRQRDDLGQAREALLAQRRVLNLAHSGSNPAAIISAVAQLTDRQVALIDRDGRSIAATQGFDEGAEQSQRLSVGSGRELVAPGPPLEPEGAAAFTSAAMVLSIDDRTRAHNSVIERERWGRVTKAIVTGAADPQRLVHLLDPDITLPERVHVLVVQGQAEAISAWRSQHREGSMRLITRYPLNARTQPATPQGVVLAWQVVSPELAGEAIENITIAGLDVAVGVETELQHAEVSRRSAEALVPRLSSAERLYRTPRTPRVFRATESNALLELLLAAPESPSASHAVLGSLSLHDPSCDHEARETLRVFLEQHGQRGVAAEVLGIHRNTLRARLERIESMIGVSLESADDRAQLWLALRVDG